MSRAEVLARVRSLVGESSAEHSVKESRAYCLVDGEHISVQLTQSQFQHGDHISTRAFLFLPGARWEFRPDGELLHFTAAAVLWRAHEGERKYCLFRRRTHP